MKKSAKITAMFATVVLSFAIFSNAMAAGEDGGKPRRGGPPAEAFEACANLAVDDACSFSSPRGEASGQCVAPPRGDEQQLVCKPEGMGKAAQ